MTDQAKRTVSVLLSFEPEIHDLPGLAVAIHMAAVGMSDISNDAREKDGLVRLAQVLEEKTKKIYNDWHRQIEEARGFKEEPPQK